jgi:hypothetical protein
MIGSIIISFRNLFKEPLCTQAITQSYTKKTQSVTKKTFVKLSAPLCSFVKQLDLLKEYYNALKAIYIY